jgi:transcription antitermination factor NusG
LIRAYLYEPEFTPADHPIYNWHVIKAVSGKEKDVAKYLADYGIETFCPMQLVTTYAKGRLHEKTIALFRNYLFARWESDNPHDWHHVTDTTGVIEIIGGTHPKIIDDETIQRWQKRVDDRNILDDEELVKTLGDLRRGWSVDDLVFCTGAYHGHRCRVIEIDETSQTVRLEISLLGRNNVIERRVDECSYAGSNAPDIAGNSRRTRKRGGRKARQVKILRQRHRNSRRA